MRDFQSHQKWPPKANFTMYEGKQKYNNNTYVFKQLMNCFLLLIKGRLLILLPVCPSLSRDVCTVWTGWEIPLRRGVSWRCNRILYVYPQCFSRLMFFDVCADRNVFMTDGDFVQSVQIFHKVTKHLAIFH